MRRALTLIELLVALAILAALVGFLFPAIQKARTAADRIRCENNLRQMGLACLQYHDQLGSLPPGYLATATYPDTSPGWGWGAFLLPFLEQENLHARLNFAKPIEQSPAVSTVVSVFVCPAEPFSPEPFDVTDDTLSFVVRAGPCSYAATVGSDASEADGATGNGVFYRNSATRLADVTDGLSSTVLLGDRAFSQTKGIWAGAPHNAVARAGVLNPWPYATGTAAVLVLAHNNWVNIRTDSDGGLDDFSSNHPGGANLLFADGAVHFLHDITVDGQERRDFWALGTRDGRELIRELEY